MRSATATYKPIIGMLVITLVLMIAIPAGLAGLLSKTGSRNGESRLQAAPDDMKIKIYLKEQKQVVELPLEEYVKGVVAAEMPVTFSMEALKAQAIAARTNAVRRIQKNLLTPEGAHITDDHRDVQAYSSDEKLKKRWGVFEYQFNLNKIAQAVNETRGQILSYNGEPIDALFFSASNGKTENSQDYWGRPLPYLRSVDSPWDKQTKYMEGTKSIPLEEFHRLLGIPSAVTAANQNQTIQVLETSATNRVKKIRVAGITITGPQFRETLGLASTDFSWKVEGSTITFTTRGNGHGVGMSQYGAEGMAKEGKQAHEILSHFYQGATLTPYQTAMKE
ncbi:stage II sporulation protein D [Effusibacillus lacus]|uniref:Stage II sporulation protein D n=1 Tax=Effusibacillus lacus TaxID=1348429 RepID=A0A292YML4_9BACL|nr:stage II sporulation protein D [Effusibacillus lacus]TCS71798.1 stage II sporulation protein D [Effusibacillus lacus]GAX89634.1 stage II sporulation protein D [Effusibacillus lacus]